MEVEKPKQGPPRIQNYSSYRKFLEDYYGYQKSKGRGFSYRLFAKKAGMKSPNYLQLVIQGKRNLSDASAHLVARAMKLKKDESKLFVALVALSNAEGEQAIDRAERAFLRCRKNLVSTVLPNKKAQLLSRWQHLVVLELVSLPDFRPEPAWVSRKLKNLITEKQAEDSLKLLFDLGMIFKEAGIFKISYKVLDTGDGFSVEHVNESHRQNLALWREELPQILPEDREVGVLNFVVNPELLPELKKKIRDFQDEVIGLLESETPRKEAKVYQLGTFLLPLSEGSVD